MKIIREIIDRLLTRTTTFFATGTFPVFALAALIFFQIFVTVVVFWPPSGSVWASFAEEFRIRCFQYDPNSGWMLWSQVMMMISEPILLQVIIFLIWRKQLKEIWSKHRRSIFPATTSALVVVCLVAGTLVGFGRPKNTEPELPFPGERIRTKLNLPWIPLADQNGKEIVLEDFKGKVVLITGVYSTCTATCPMILMQLHRVFAELSSEEVEGFSAIAVSLDPEKDTVERRLWTVKQYAGEREANMHFVNGIPSDVETVLNNLQIARMRNTQTGEIDHANLFVLIDRQGKVAFRLTSSERHESWLMSAVRHLIQDKPKDDGRVEQAAVNP
ncbi:MAG: SCO family protein [Verrucomicrobia bacterium]|nr:SCO family protein [Verrucomicrobiota bacterium]